MANERSNTLSFNDLLRMVRINPADVVVFRHRPSEPELRKVLPLLAVEKPDLFNAYQQTQSSVLVERALGSLVGRGYVAAFIGQSPKQATFVGLYRVAGAKQLTRTGFLALRSYEALSRLDSTVKSWFTPEMEKKRPTVQFFDLQKSDLYRAWQGRLIVSWPSSERSWWRRSHRNEFSVMAIHEINQFIGLMPEWEEIIFSWEQLRTIPSEWKKLISQWRGIYYIYDSNSRKGYVGSAYGKLNLLGRWEGYRHTGDGGNKLLRDIDPINLKFSILQRVSPDMSDADIIRLESNWKSRLHTRAPLGLNLN